MKGINPDKFKKRNKKYMRLTLPKQGLMCELNHILKIPLNQDEYECYEIILLTKSGISGTIIGSMYSKNLLTV